jgi:predicted nucleic acid-binding protein
VVLVQEFLFHRLRRGDRALAVQQARDVAALCVLHAFDAVVAARVLDLVASSDVRGRDAMHAATALLHGFESLVSPDRDFDDVPGLSRVDPAAMP